MKGHLRWPLPGALTATSQHLPVSCAARPEGVIAVRKLMAGPALAGSPRVADAAASLVLAARKLATAPIQLPWPQGPAGASLASGVCILSSPPPAGVTNDRIQPPAGRPGGTDKFTVISGTVPPPFRVLSVPPAAGRWCSPVRAASPRGAATRPRYDPAESPAAARRALAAVGPARHLIHERPLLRPGCKERRMRQIHILRIVPLADWRWPPAC